MSTTQPYEGGGNEIGSSEYWQGLYDATVPEFRESNKRAIACTLYGVVELSVDYPTVPNDPRLRDAMLENANDESTKLGNQLIRFVSARNAALHAESKIKR